MPTPAPIAVGNIVQAIFESNCLGQRCLNVLMYRCANLPVNTAYNAAIPDFRDTIFAGDGSGTVEQFLVAAMAQNCALESCTVQRVYPTRDYYFRKDGQTAGGIANDCTAPNVSAVINKQADRAGRGRHGSFHQPGIPANAYTGGNLTDAYLSILFGMVTAITQPQMLVSGSSYVWVPVLWTPGHSGTTDYSNIVNAESQRTLRVMRRRTVGLGI